MLPCDLTPLSGSRNVSLSVDGSKLYIYCCLAIDFGSSTTGKSTIIATSSGNKPLGATNAFLGLNLFCTDLSERRLDAEATAGMQEMTTFGKNCLWCIKGDLLCVLIDFAEVKEWTASSGRSMMLASSNGAKEIGATGILCGMNCHVPLGREFRLENMSSICGVSSFLVGDKMILGNGFMVHIESDTQVTVHHEFLHKHMVGAVTMPPFYLHNDLDLKLQVKMRNPKQRAEENVLSEEGVDFVEPWSRSQNLLVRCKVVGSTTFLDLRFDPTTNFGFSSNGRSVRVASSGGWCEVPHGVLIKFYANKLVSSPTPVDIASAVAKVFGTRDKEELMLLSFKTIVMEVLQTLGRHENEMESIRQQVKHAVVEYFQCNFK